MVSEYLSKARSYYQLHPLRTILILAALARFISVLFSQGYGFSDDHFLVIEVAQQWIDHNNQKLWMPWGGNEIASGHSLFYPGLHYFFFLFLKSIGVVDPVFKMYLVRAVHAVYSLSIVYFSFKISKHLSGDKVARIVGMLVGLYWFMPMLSVRNMVEMVCIPPLIYATWILLKSSDKNRASGFLLAGMIAGIAFSVRFQTAIFIGGMGLVLLLNKKWRETIFFGFGALVSAILLQGVVDYVIWGKPFAEFVEYFRYNAANATNYIVGPWYNYTLLLLGIFIPPVSFFIVYGLFKSPKKYLLIILPALLFLLFHSFFPNKQERFIMPVIPFFIIAGMAGWIAFEERSAYWIKNQKLKRNLVRFFWTLNLLLLMTLTPSSTKISRVNAMTYLSEKKDLNRYMMETSNSWDPIFMPAYYINNWREPYNVCGKIPARMNFDSIQILNLPVPDYIVFAEKENLKARVDTIRKFVKGLEFEKEIEPSFLDKAMHFLNPVNVNQTYYIYKVRKE